MAAEGSTEAPRIQLYPSTDTKLVTPFWAGALRPRRRHVITQRGERLI
jgi:hypothetical protein